jgi:hypothetical protein
MDYLNERVAYLRGLVEGLGISENTNEGKILINIVDILSDIVEAISELEASQAELDEYVETLDEDLTDVEDQVYGDIEDEEDEEDEEPLYIEVECPNCHETVYFDEELFDSEEDLICPNCHETIYAEEDGEDDELENDELDSRE